MGHPARLSDVLGARLPFDSYRVLKAEMQKAVPHLARVERVTAFDGDTLGPLLALGGDLERAPFRSPVTDFYLTNPIARSSAVMAECSALSLDHMRQAAE